MTTSGPSVLWLVAPAALLLVALATRKTTREIPRWRLAAALAVRALSVILLTVVLVRPLVTVQVEPSTCTIFLVDVSESVPRRALEAALDDLRRAWEREIASGRRCGLVAFAGRAETVIPPGVRAFDAPSWRLDPRSALERLSAAAEKGDPAAAPAILEIQKWADALQTGSTDVARGLSAARALYQEGSANRIVLLTDGIDPAPVPDLPPGLTAIRLHDPARRDAAVVGVSAPLTARSGEPFDVRVTVHTSTALEFGLSLLVDDRRVPGSFSGRRYRSEGPGPVTVLIENLQQDRALEPGRLHRLRVMLDSPGDEEPRNNFGVAPVTVTGRPRILLVEGTPAEGEALARMLTAQDMEFVRESPAQAAAREGSLEEFVAVLLAGVPREALSDRTVSTLRGYVEASGGGLLVVGSPSLQGSAGYAGSALEKLLPVRFTAETAGAGPDPSPPPPTPSTAPPPPTPGAPGPAQRVLSPSVAILFAVDKSGSMAGKGIALVKEAVIGSIKALTPRDFVAVLAFDQKPKWVIRFTEADRQGLIQDMVLRLFADGGTHIYPALAEAHREFKSDPRARRAAVKHVILLSDGDTQPSDFETLVRQMAEDGITVTAVCVSAKNFDPGLMSQIAGWGKGRFQFADSFEKVPQIFVQDVARVLGQAPAPDPPPALPPKADPPRATPPPAAPEERRPLRVTARDPHEVLQGIDGAALPSVRGLLAATAQPGAAVALAAADGKPVLALRRAGVGKTAVWTSDLSGRWTPEWLLWKDSGKLFAQIVRFVSSAAPDADFAARVRVVPPQVRIDPGPEGESFLASDAATGAPLALVRRPDGGTAVDVPPSPEADVRAVRVRRQDGTALLVGVPRVGDPEFAPPEAGRDLFAGALRAGTWPELESMPADARMSADRRIDLSPWLLLAAVLLLPLDVALRRYNA